MIKEKFQLTQYLLVLLLIYSSGMVMFQGNYAVSLLLIGGFVIGLLLIKPPKTKISMEQILLGLALSSLILLSLFANLDIYNLDTYAGILIKIFIAFIACLYLDLTRFKTVYCRILFALVLLSFPFYIMGIVNPDFIHTLPVLTKRAGVDFGNAIFYVYSLPVWETGLMRNNGVFWEPGAFQAFINLALLLEISNPKKSIVRIIVFVIGVLTTASTTGYFVLLLISFIAIVGAKSKALKAGVALLLILFVSSPVFQTYVAGKFSEDGERFGSYTRRDSDWKTDLTIVYENNPVTGVGFDNYYNQFSQTISKYMGEEAGISSSNSLTFTLAAHGLLFFCCIVSMNVMFSSAISKELRGIGFLNFICVLLILFLVYASEPFLTTPIWMVLGFYGVHAWKRSQERSIQWKRSYTSLTVQPSNATLK